VYRPLKIPSTVNSPLRRVTVLDVSLVATLTTVIAAPGSGPPSPLTDPSSVIVF
jgi:hypothetical protein